MCEQLSKNLKHKMKQTFRNDELRRFGTLDHIDLDDDDIEFVVRQVWKSRCAVTNRKFGGHSTLMLTRWYPDQLPSPHNLVLLLPDQALKLAEKGKAHIPASVVQSIDNRLQWAKMVYAEDFTYAKGAYKLRVKTEPCLTHDSQGAVTGASRQRANHKPDTKSLLLLAEISAAFLVVALCKNTNIGSLFR